MLAGVLVAPPLRRLSDVYIHICPRWIVFRSIAVNRKKPDDASGVGFLLGERGCGGNYQKAEDCNAVFHLLVLILRGWLWAVFYFPQFKMIKESSTPIVRGTLLDGI
jgi:hypothetical protein